MGLGPREKVEPRATPELGCTTAQYKLGQLEGKLDQLKVSSASSKGSSTSSTKLGRE